MRPVLTAAEMREADRRTIEGIGLPGAVLMENAGAAVARVVDERFPGARRPLVVCGKGNNGGDGFVVARRLLARRPAVVLVGARGEVSGDARVHMEAFERSGGTLVEVKDVEAWAGARSTFAEADLVIDAVLGTGLRQQPSGLPAQAIAEMTAARSRGVPVVAVDVPSGIPSDADEVSWETVVADVTVTFAAPKYGHVLPPSCDLVGELVVADIGIPAAVVFEVEPRLWLLEEEDVRRAYPPRDPAAHKGRFGHVLVVAGSVGKTGAALLAATGALASGVGLVTVATAAPALPMVAAGRPEVMTEALPATAAGSIDADALEHALALASARDAVVLGPGLGQEPSTRAFAREFVRRCPVPLVVDADGLNALAPAAGPRDSGALQALRREMPTVITPHPGEMARLIGSSIGDVQRRRVETARALALEAGTVVVLKGHRTVVVRPDGRAAVNPTGNAGMATAGTGDVLSGIMGALLARGHDSWAAATAGVYLHGAAGDLAAERHGPEGLLAGHLVLGVAEVLRRLAPARRAPGEVPHS